MIDFFESVVPCRYTTSKRLISRDTHSNTYNYKFTYSVEIVPICKDNIVCLPAKLSKDNGNIGPICICTRVTKQIHLLDPTTLKGIL
jgi:nonsense-mediated mRNA decay protein 3